MLLRAIAVVVSLLIHGLIGYAIWPRLQLKELEVLDLGKGPDIVLTPQGSAISEMTNRGDDVASIEAQEVVPIEQRQTMPQPEAVEPLEKLHDVANDVESKKTQEVVAVQEQKTILQSPTVKPREQLHDVVGDVETQKTQEVVAIEERKPPPQNPTVMAAEQLHDVIASEKSVVEEKIVKTTDPPSEQLNEPKVVEADEPSLPDGVKQSNVVEANEPPAPAQPKEPKVVTADEPPPADHLEEQKVAKANKTVPLETIEDQKPKVAEVEVQPEQVAIMTEQNSGVAKTGGDARVVGLYLGKVNERVQRSKVNPSSRETGIVVLKFTIGTDGSLLSKDVALSSGSLVLDIAALKTLIRAAPFPPIPAEVSLRPMVFTQVFKFVIR